MGLSEQKIRFYFDENMPVEAARQLNEHGIDTLTAKDVKRLGLGDPVQLQYAIDTGRTICTYDKHFVDLAKLGIEHCGIAYFRGKIGDIGRIVRALRHLHKCKTSESMKYRVAYLSHNRRKINRYERALERCGREHMR